MQVAASKRPAPVAESAAGGRCRCRGNTQSAWRAVCCVCPKVLRSLAPETNAGQLKQEGNLSACCWAVHRTKESQDPGFRKRPESAAMGIYSSSTPRLLSWGRGGGGPWGSISSGFSPSCTIPHQLPAEPAGIPRRLWLIGWQGLWAQVCAKGGQTLKTQAEAGPSSKQSLATVRRRGRVC